ncbi:hypothetical protein KAR91_34495 [Candidatus Pacearchaeota archaeon]|nr:hypothetical protein [Candidatus Pacearchaeota archaeon]
MESDISNDEIKQVLSRCAYNTKNLALTIFPEVFYAPFTKLHDEIFRLIDSGARRIAIAAPRGIGKTTIARTIAARKLLFNQCHFIVYVSNSSSSAEMQTENLKHELISNELVSKIFGPIKTKRADGVDESFSKRSWVSRNTIVYPRGSGQQIRGLVYHNHRPDLFIVDDLEDTETIENEEIRKKRKLWFHSDLLKATSRLDRNWQIIYIDTLKHEDALLEELIESSEWESVRLEICGDNYKSKCPEFMPDEEIAAELKYHREHGILDTFYREFRNIPISTEDATFMQKNFKYYTEAELKNNGAKNIENVLIADPAKSVKMHSAESAVIAVGISMTDNKIYFRDCVSRKMYPDELYDCIFDMRKLWNCHAVGIEVTGLEEFIKQPIKNEIIKRGPSESFEPVWLKARGGPAEGGKGKIKRIAALAPFYRQGYVYHNRECCGGLEAQLMGFPRSKKMDIMDAFAYIIEMMELGERYFEPVDDGSVEFGDPESEYKELEDDYDEPVQGWRLHGV